MKFLSTDKTIIIFILSPQNDIVMNSESTNKPLECVMSALKELFMFPSIKRSSNELCNGSNVVMSFELIIQISTDNPTFNLPLDVINQELDVL
ncbi:CLUMA_CG001760, isoform A [Clunio marinus]|uniref:CLUMA_CG001760, isoform A n=1 Tax=Clunio marinus TaxID=568069 RepID=A0A1J1HNC8_9DIPT|nr:CLUMA_CG001760, isoform A [Clunio marinus]